MSSVKTNKDSTNRPAGSVAVQDAIYQEGYRIRVFLTDGTNKLVDFSGFFYKNEGLFGQV